MGAERFFAGLGVAVAAGAILLGKAALRSCDGVATSVPKIVDDGVRGIGRMGDNIGSGVSEVADGGAPAFVSETQRVFRELKETPSDEALRLATTVKPHAKGVVKVDGYAVSSRAWLAAHGAKPESLNSAHTHGIFGSVAHPGFPPAPDHPSAARDEIVSRLASETNIDVKSCFEVLSIEPSNALRAQWADEAIKAETERLVATAAAEGEVLEVKLMSSRPFSQLVHHRFRSNTPPRRSLVPILIMPDLGRPEMFKAVMGYELSEPVEIQFKKVEQAFRAQFPDGKVVTTAFELERAVKQLYRGNTEVIVMGHSVARESGGNERDLVLAALGGDSSKVARLSESKILSEFGCAHVLTCYGKHVGIDAEIRFADLIPMAQAGIESSRTAHTRQQVIDSMRRARRSEINHRLAISTLKVTTVGGASGVALLRWTGEKRDPRTTSSTDATSPSPSASGPTPSVPRR
jgi:hypothetical protein